MPLLFTNQKQHPFIPLSFLTVLLLISTYPKLTLSAQPLKQPLYVYNTSSTWISKPALLGDKLYVSILQWEQPGYTILSCFNPILLEKCGYSSLQGESITYPVSDGQFVYMVAQHIHQLNENEHYRYLLQGSSEESGGATEINAFGQCDVKDNMLYVAIVGGAMYALEVKRHPQEIVDKNVLWETIDTVKISSRQDLQPFVTNDHIYTYSDLGQVLKINRTNGEISFVASLKDLQSFSSSPIVGDGMLFVGLADGTLWGIDLATLDIRIGSKFAGAILAQPAYQAGVLFFGGSDGCVYAVNSTGKSAVILWKYKTYAQIKTTPVIFNGIVYVGSDDSFVYGLDLITGVVKWRRQLESPIVSSVVINRTNIYCTTEGKTLYKLEAYNPTDDSMYNDLDKLIVSFAENEFVQNGILKVIYEDSLGIFLYVTSFGHVGAVLQDTLKHVWRKQLDMQVSEAYLEVYNGTHLIVTTQAQVVVFELKGGGDKLWQNDIVAPQGQVLVVNDAVIVVNTEGLFHYELLSGVQGWRRKDLGTIVAPAIHDNYNIYVLSGDGILHILEYQKGSSIATKEMTGPSLVKPYLLDDVVYVVGGGNVYALNSTEDDLQELWYQTIGGTTLAHPILQGSMLYIASSKMVYVFHQDNGKIEWEKSLPTLIKSIDLRKGIRREADKYSILVETIDQNVFVLDSVDGTLEIFPENDLMHRYGYEQFMVVIDELLLYKANPKTKRNATVQFVLEDRMVYLDVNLLYQEDSPLMKIMGMRNVLEFLEIQLPKLSARMTPVFSMPVNEDQFDLEVDGEFPKEMLRIQQTPKSSSKQSGIGSTLTYSLVFGGILILLLFALFATWRTRVHGLRLYRSTNYTSRTNNNTTPSYQPQLTKPSSSKFVIRTLSQVAGVGGKYMTAKDLPIISKYTKAARNVDLNIDFYKELDIRMEIGSGGFGIVLGGIYTPQNQNVQYEVAIKQLHNNFFGKTKEQVQKEFDKEIILHAMLSHPNIVKCFGSTQSPRAIVMEYCHAGSLQEYIYTFRQGYPLPLQEVLDIGLQIADGLAYLHPHIMHLDLKPQNILFDANLVVKLADFGLSKWKDDSLHHTRTITGTVNYMAPEQFTEFAGISERADIWSLGMVMWECITGSKPYEKREFAQQYTAIVIKKQRPPIPQKCPSQIVKLISQCWQHEHLRRPSAVDIVHRIKCIKDEFSRQELDRISTQIRTELGFGQQVAFAQTDRPMTQSLHTMKYQQECMSQVESDRVGMVTDSRIGLLKAFSQWLHPNKGSR